MNNKQLPIVVLFTKQKISAYIYICVCVCIIMYIIGDVFIVRDYIESKNKLLESDLKWVTIGVVSKGSMIL